MIKLANRLPVGRLLCQLYISLFLKSVFPAPGFPETLNTMVLVSDASTASRRLPAPLLKLNKEALMNDLKYCGFLFESLVYHDLKMYARANDADISHYRDSTGLKLNSVIDTTKFSKPASLNIITGTGMTYTRPDGVNVISVASLGK